jgi:transposase-like protein
MDSTVEAFNPPPVRIHRRSFCEHEKAGALALLDANGGKIRETARQLGICHRTLHRWATEGYGIDDRVLALEGIAREELANRFEDEAHAALDEAPAKRDAATYQQLITGAAIAIDKMRLLREQATSIHTQQLSDEERIARLNELLATALTLPAAAAEEQSEEQSALPAAAHEQPDADDCT